MSHLYAHGNSDPEDWPTRAEAEADDRRDAEADFEPPPDDEA